MKVDQPGLTHYATQAEYLAKKSGKVLPEPKVPLKDKVELESKKEEVEQKAKETLKDPLGPGQSIVQAAAKLVGEAKAAVLNNIPIITPKAVENVKVDPPKTEIIDRPGIFFVSGFQLANLSSDDGGIKEMAKHVPDASHYEWYEENKIIDEIKKRPAFQPIVLVGHSLGGDAVVNLANKLNTMEHGFKNIDLLVTLDSVGFDNDIIPGNVRKNLNFIGNNDYFFNDGPNIARDTNFTEVINELRGETHTGIDEARDVQHKIYLGISKVIGDTTRFNQLVEQTYQRFSDVNKRANALLGNQ